MKSQEEEKAIMQRILNALKNANDALNNLKEALDYVDALEENKRTDKLKEEDNKQYN